GGDEPADDGTDAARRAAQSGHVPRRLLPHVSRLLERHRGPPLRSRARGTRSAHTPARRGHAMNDALPHYVSPEPFDPGAVEAMTPAQERFFMASQWRMMWWKLKRHRLAVLSGAVLVAMYLSILVSEFLAPYALRTRHVDFIFAPPQTVHLFRDGRFVGPFVYGSHYRLDMRNPQRVYTEDPSVVQPLRFFCGGERYLFWGVLESDLHLVCPAKNGQLFLLGTDRLGRDMLSRILYGAR